MKQLENGKGWAWKKKSHSKPKWTSRNLAIVALVLVTALGTTAAVTKIDLPTQVKGILAVANGGTGTASTLTGLVRGSGTAMTAAELSGDATTSASNAVTVVKINGTTITTNAAADQVIVTSASGTAVWKSVPDCVSGALNYTASTHTFGCATILTGTFADGETPSGTIDGSNAVFTLAHTVSPAASLAVYKNGQEMLAGGADYTLATATITFVTAAKPQTGDTLIAFYRW